MRTTTLSRRRGTPRPNASQRACNRLLLALLAALPGAAGAADARLEPIDLFDLEIASDPRLSPDGGTVVFVRGSADIMKDSYRSSLWTVHHDGSDLRPLGNGGTQESAPRWSPDGERLLFTASEDGSAQLFVRWLDSGQQSAVTRLPKAPQDAAWSPDGKWIAFSMEVADATEAFVEMPAKPEGAEWARPAKTIRRMNYRADGAGYLEEAHSQLFVVPAEGGTPRQLSSGPYDHGGPLAWSPDGKSIVFAANRREDAEYQPLDSDIHEIAVADGSLRRLTERNGPDYAPVLSADGRRIAWLGFDDREQGYQVRQLYVMDRDGSNKRVVTQALDRDVEAPVWSGDGKGLYFQYDDQGDTRLAFASLDGQVQTLATGVGGVSHGRPYPGGSFSVAADGRFAFTLTRPGHPADIATGRRGSRKITRVTRLNDDLFAGKELAAVEEIRFESSVDGRAVQGWIAKPPGFDAARKYPLVLEIHGGPFSNYGDRFSSEIQLFAAAGYVVLYLNPRGSTSYGEEFGNLIHHAYPGDDYHDLMSGVDALLARGYVDPQQLFVTGGSGGGTLTAWIVGKTDRFRAAVVAKPVINWYSFVLTSDGTATYQRYWFPGVPWEHAAHYLSRSPLSLVGKVNTPTLLITGEADYRTPISESEQYYEALKLRKVDTALVRIPEASHGMDGRPSHLLSKVVHILRWFETHRGGAAATREPGAQQPDGK